MNNRKHNATNPYQGSRERVLCVCSAGLLRSPTVAHVMACKGYNTRSAGLEKEFALISVDEVLLHWADTLVVMNIAQAHELSKVFEGGIFNFDLPDNFEYMDKELVGMIEHRLARLQDWRFQ